MSEKKAPAVNPLHSKNIPPPPPSLPLPVPIPQRLPESRVSPLPGSSDLPERDEERATIELSLYLRPRHDEKLEDLRRAYKRRTGKKISANELIRRLIDQASIEDVLT